MRMFIGLFTVCFLMYYVSGRRQSTPEFRNKNAGKQPKSKSGLRTRSGDASSLMVGDYNLDDENEPLSNMDVMGTQPTSGFSQFQGGSKPPKGPNNPKPGVVPVPKYTDPKLPDPLTNFQGGSFDCTAITTQCQCGDGLSGFDGLSNFDQDVDAQSIAFGIVGNKLYNQPPGSTLSNFEQLGEGFTTFGQPSAKFSNFDNPGGSFTTFGQPTGVPNRPASKPVADIAMDILGHDLNLNK